MNRAEIVKQITTDYELTFSHTDAYGGKHYIGKTYSLHDCSKFNYVRVYQNNPYDEEGCRTGGVMWEIDPMQELISMYTSTIQHIHTKPYTNFNYEK